MSAELLIATSNKGKLREFRGLLGAALKVSGVSDAPYDKHPVPDVPELGETYFENALVKAVGYYRRYRVPLLADDSGIEVDVLNGSPGVHSARFGGLGMPWPDRWRMLQAAVASHTKEKWTCRFRAVLCYYDGVNVPQFFQGICEGVLADAPRGTGGFGYDPMMISNELGKTFAEATDDEKARVSHRAKAVRAFLQWHQARG